MLPELRALFDLPRRFLPGLGARVHGYADKKGIEGIQATGANGVFTLGRSETSGTIPSLGTDEEPAALRAGPGVRIHGYGGIHTLERLPVAPPEETPLGPARLEWEIERSQGFCQVCAVGFSTESPGNWVEVSELTWNFTGGSYVDSETASGDITPYGPNDTPPANCAAIIYDSTYDGEIEYGDYQDSSLAETLISFASVAPSAIAQLDVWSSPTGSQEWTKDTWRDVSEEVTPFTTTLGGSVSLSYRPASAEARSLRFRLINSGSVSLRVNCGFYGSGISGGAADIESAIDLAPGQTSAWQTPPNPDADALKYRTAEIRRVRIGRWRFIT